MHFTIDYGKSQSPAFDAVEDVKWWLGDKWNILSPQMFTVKNCGVFAFYASLAGVQGFPVKAWYELYHGQGSWKPEELENIT